MSSARVHFHQASRVGATAGEPAREIQELWFTLAQRRWTSLVLVPADEGLSAASVATQLADVGSQLREMPITAVVAEELDSESARMLTDLQLRVRERSTPSRDGVIESHIVLPQLGPASRGREAGAGGDAPADEGESATIPLGDAALLIAAIQPVVVEPLGVAIAQAADTVVICLQIGKTRLEAARRTVELIGPERVAGAFLIK